MIASARFCAFCPSFSIATCNVDKMAAVLTSSDNKSALRIKIRWEERVGWHCLDCNYMSFYGQYSTDYENIYKGHNPLTTAIVFIPLAQCSPEEPRLPSTNQHWGYSHIWATMNTTVMNMRILILLKTNFKCMKNILRIFLGSMKILTFLWELGRMGLLGCRYYIQMYQNTYIKYVQLYINYNNTTWF